MITLNSYPKITAGIVLLAIVYIVTGLLGLQLAVPPGYATVFWPPSGLALAAVYLFGYPISIGVFLGAFGVNVINMLGGDVSIGAIFNAFFIGLGSTAQACLGASLLKKYIGSETFLESFREIFKFSVIAGPISCLVACSVGVLTLVFNGYVSLDNAPYTWMNWYVGDMLGVLVFVPALIIFFSGGSVSKERKIYTIFPLLFMFVLVVMGFFSIKAMDKGVRVADFETDVELISQEIDHNIEEHFKELYGLLALYNASDEVDRREFNTFATHTIDRNLTAGIAYVPIVTQDNKASFQSVLAKNDMEDFSLKKYSGEPHDQTCLPYCLPVLFVYPMDKDKKVVGLDLASEPTRIKTIQEAIIHQNLRISAPAKLADSNNLRFIAVLPISTENISKNGNVLDQVEGFLVSGSLYDELFGNVLDKWLSKGLQLKVTDLSADSVVFENDSMINRDNDFVVTMEKEIGGRTWQLRFYITDQYLLSNVNWNIWFALAASLLLTFFVSIFLLAVTGQTAAIEALVHQKTKELSDKNSFLKVIMDSVPDLIFVKNKNSEIVQGNKAFLKQFSPDIRYEIIGSVPYGHYSENEAKVFKKQDKLAFKKGYSETNQTNTDYLGAKHDYFARKIRFETEDGTPYVLAVLRDITDEKKMLENLRQSEKRFRASLENAPIGMSLVDMDQNWIVYNKSLCETLGYDEEEFSQKTLKSLTHPDDLKKDSEQLKQLIKGSIDSFSVEKRYFKKHGGFAWVLLTLALVRNDDNQPLYFVAHTLDVTERKKMEGELRRSNEELEQFAYVASHDLKAPLRHISLSAGFFAEQYKDKLDDNGKELISIMTRGTQRMHDMIESLLEYSRVGQKDAKDMEDVKFSEIIKIAKEPLKLAIDETNAKISILGAKTVIKAHKILLVQLFQNLIQNAIKYRKDDVAPKIKIEAQKGKSDITISISDNGIGIDEKYAKKIFDVFQRLHGDEQYEGMGIGLAICKRIIDTHNGKIWLDTNYNDGCKFIIKLPMV